MIVFYLGSDEFAIIFALVGISDLQTLNQRLLTKQQQQLLKQFCVDISVGEYLYQ